MANKDLLIHSFIHSFKLENTCIIITARCTLVQSAVLWSHVVCLSVCLSVCLWRWWIVIT